jgi:hypothetical protein
MRASSEVHGTSVAAITSVGSPSWDELLAPEANTAIAAVSGCYLDVDLVDEHMLSWGTNVEIEVI